MHEIDEQIQRVGNEVFITTATFFNDHLGVPHNESTEKQNASPKVDLKKKKDSILIFTKKNISKMIVPGKSGLIGKIG